MPWLTVAVSPEKKMELDGYMVIEGEDIAVYNHQNKNQLCTMVALNKKVLRNMATQ